jgi:membrane-bound metal-dependent hydrolase YbcI (DUF457 family)
LLIFYLKSVKGDVLRLYQHAIISILISGAVFLIFKSVTASALALLSGVLIDGDHLLDYFIKIKWKLKSFSIKNFFYTYRTEDQPKYYLLLHSFELSVFFPFLLFLIGCKEAAAGVFLGYFPHMVLDRIFNGGHPFGYFLIYRAIRKFKIY